jgi:uncharacterized membrane protein YsdA (DUF1294 family)
MTVALFIVLWLVLIDALTVRAFRADKRIAREGGRRVSEKDLLTLALIGGSPGALFARRRFRHKTRKQPFSTNLILTCLAQLAAAILFALSRL